MDVLDSSVKIEQLKLVGEYMDGLTELLIRVVEDGASIGFLPPMEISDAEEYWRGISHPEEILFIAYLNQRVVGSIQLHLCPGEPQA